MRFRLSACCLLMLAWSGAARAAVPPLNPAMHDDFDHYTLALTWQPGFCADGSCLDDTPRTPLIGLHGLWASLPRSLSDRGIVDRQWWGRGCDYFHRSRAYPSLPVGVRRALDATMPHTRGNLLRHEFDKHVQCMGYDTTGFFQTELAMRDAVAATPFATELAAHAGQSVSRDAVLAAFARSFRIDRPRALQLQCHNERSGQAVLAQLWITVRSDLLADFPAPSSLMDSPVPQDNCPASFTVPAW